MSIFDWFSNFLNGNTDYHGNGSAPQLATPVPAVLPLNTPTGFTNPLTSFTNLPFLKGLNVAEGGSVLSTLEQKRITEATNGYTKKTSHHKANTRRVRRQKTYARSPRRGT